MNACSSSERPGYGSWRVRFQSGLPLNSSPSIQTVPAVSAVRSVSEMTGRNFSAFIVRMIGPDTSVRRRFGMLKTAMTAA